MHRLALALAASLALPVAARAQAPAADPLRHPLRTAAPQAAASLGSAGFDQTYAHLALDLDGAAQRLAGRVRIEGTLTTPLSRVDLDLAAPMVVSGVTDGAGQAVPFARPGDVLALDLGGVRPAGTRLAFEIAYAGTPPPSGFGSFAWSSADGQPAVWTLSEPYGARTWWPVKDHPSDKLDSVRLVVTVPRGLTVGGNGLLESETTASGRTTFAWASRYPIAPYLVAFAAGSYGRFAQTYARPADLAAEMGPASVPVVHYPYTAGGAATLPAGWAEVLDVLPVFERWFGPYPFAREKYGHVAFGWGGGMEHQTMSSMGGASTLLVAHELAHQWFGDAVTARTWPHLWLNEGFASYGELLYWEASPERYPGRFRSELAAFQSRARSAPGTLVVQDTANVSTLFDSRRVYAKGAAVVHMLRRVLGDDAFRATLRAYQADPALCYGTATTEDLRRVAEAVSGRDLGAFFRQWVTDGTGHPVYAVSWTSAPAAGGGSDVAVTIRQTQDAATSTVEVFEMPVTVEVVTAAGAERFTVQNTAREQTTVLHVEAAPTAVRLDPDGDLLRAPDVVVTDREALVVSARTWRVGPSVTRGPVEVAGRGQGTGRLAVEVVDVLGRVVARRSARADGPVRLALDLSGLAAGRYLVVVREGAAVAASRPVLLVR